MEHPNFVVLGVPGYKHVDFPWIQNFWSFEWPVPPAIVSASSAYLPDAHNLIVESFLSMPVVRDPQAHGFERAYLCLLEQDVFPHPRFTFRAQEYVEPVVGQLVHRKTYDDQRPLAGFFVERRGWRALDDQTYDRWTTSELGLHRVDITAMGCTFLRADVLMEWPAAMKPWFKWVPSRWGRGASDDLQFHADCKDLGIETYLDTHELAQCGHLGSLMATVKTSRDWRGRTRVEDAVPDDPDATILRLVKS